MAVRSIPNHGSGRSIFLANRDRHVVGVNPAHKTEPVCFVVSSHCQQFWPDSVALHESLTREVLKMAPDRVQIQFNVPVVDFFRAVESPHVPTRVVPSSSPRATAATRTLNLVTQRVQFHDLQLRRALAERACEMGLDSVVLKFEQKFVKPYVSDDFHVEPFYRQSIVNAATRRCRQH